jgi:hypothetical protein
MAFVALRVAVFFSSSRNLPGGVTANGNNGDYTLAHSRFHFLRKCLVDVYFGELRTVYLHADIWSVDGVDIVLEAVSLILRSTPQI